MALVRPSEDGLLCEVCPSLMAGQLKTPASIIGHLPLLTGGIFGQ